jgi:hypothetical protein
MSATSTIGYIAVAACCDDYRGGNQAAGNARKRLESELHQTAFPRLARTVAVVADPG